MLVVPPLLFAAAHHPDKTILGHLTQRHLHFPARGHVSTIPSASKHSSPKLTGMHSYFVTELLGTDLHRLLTSRPLEKQFIQYFLYQIMVRPFRLRSGAATH